MSTVQKSLIRDYAKAAGEKVCEQVITELEKITTTLSGDDSPLENPWEEICVQVQGEESFFWDAYLDTMRDFILGILIELPHRDQVALWLQTEEGWNWHWDIEFEEEQSPRNERGKNKPTVPVDHENIVSYIVQEFMLPTAEDFTNLNIEVFQEGGDAYEAMKRRLVELMPLDTIVTDLWDWDIHFEDESFDDIEEAAFCKDDDIKKYAEPLANDIESWIEEYDIDYDRSNWEIPEAFSEWIKEECVKFMTHWRASVRKEFDR